MWVKTEVESCSDSAGPPGICGPSGTILPQCHRPAVLPTVCAGSGSLLPICQSEGPYIVACGGVGTILPQCNLPPPHVPEICGGSGSLLPPCKGVNNPVLVCGAAGTGVPQCSFSTKVKGSLLLPPDDGGGDGDGKIALTVSCPADLAKTSASNGLRAGQSGKPKSCNGALSLDDVRGQFIDTLTRTLRVAGEPSYAFSGNTPWYAAVVDGYNQYVRSGGTRPGAEAEKRFARFNAEAYFQRGAELLRLYLPVGAAMGGVGDGLSEELTTKRGRHRYSGEYSQQTLQDLVVGPFVGQLKAAVKFYSDLHKRAKPKKPSKNRIAPTTTDLRRSASAKPIVKKFRIPGWQESHDRVCADPEDHQADRRHDEAAARASRASGGLVHDRLPAGRPLLRHPAPRPTDEVAEPPFRPSAGSA